MMRLPNTVPIPAPEPATPTVAAPAPMNLAAVSMSRETALVWKARVTSADWLTGNRAWRRRISSQYCSRRWRESCVCSYCERVTPTWHLASTTFIVTTNLTVLWKTLNFVLQRLKQKRRVKDLPASPLWLQVCWRQKQRLAGRGLWTPHGATMRNEITDYSLRPDIDHMFISQMSKQGYSNNDNHVEKASMPIWQILKERNHFWFNDTPLVSQGEMAVLQAATCTQFTKLKG